jgi:hypothetical protein
MLIAIAVLFVLYLTGPQKDRDRQRKMPSPQIIQRGPKKAAIKIERANYGNSDCPHRFGYLSTRKQKSVPEECVGCMRVVKCLLPDE